MKERIEGLITKLDDEREDALINYLDALDKWTPGNGSMDAISRVAILQDLDRHITTLHQELKRMDAIKEAVNA